MEGGREGGRERGREGGVKRQLTILGQATPAMKSITVLADNTLQQSFLQIYKNTMLLCTSLNTHSYLL